MTGLPEFGDKVRIWPLPGRRVQNGPVRIIGGGAIVGAGNLLDPHGQEVLWSEFQLEQYRAGDILLHAPADHELPPKKEEAEAQAPVAEPTSPPTKEEDQ